MRPLIVSIQVGMPETRGADSISDKDWESGIFKFPVQGPIFLGSTNLNGDGQADQKHHGGPDRAILLYDASHYDYWQAKYPDINWGPGAFGENLSLRGCDEHSVAIGDEYAIGEAIIRVTQPRYPCWKLARRWQVKELTAEADTMGYTGWYAGVLKTGTIDRGMSLELIQRPYPQLTVAAAYQALLNPEMHMDICEALLACPAYSADYRQRLKQKLQRIN